MQCCPTGTCLMSQLPRGQQPHCELSCQLFLLASTVTDRLHQRNSKRPTSTLGSVLCSSVPKSFVIPSIIILRLDIAITRLQCPTPCKRWKIVMRRRKLFVGTSNMYNLESGRISQRRCVWYLKGSNQARPAVILTAQRLSRYHMKARGHMKLSFHLVGEFMHRLSRLNLSSLYESRSSLPCCRTC
jgi:hypothetical protein